MAQGKGLSGPKLPRIKHRRRSWAGAAKVADAMITPIAGQKNSKINTSHETIVNVHFLCIVLCLLFVDNWSGDEMAEGDEIAEVLVYEVEQISSYYKSIVGNSPRCTTGPG